MRVGLICGDGRRQMPETPVGKKNYNKRRSEEPEEEAADVHQHQSSSSSSSDWHYCSHRYHILCLETAREESERNQTRNNKAGALRGA